MFPNHNKGLQELMVLHTSQHFYPQNRTSPKNFFKVQQLNGNGTCNKSDEMQLLIKYTQAVAITIQETKFNQSHKTPNIPKFTPIKTDHTYKQGGGLLIT